MEDLMKTYYWQFDTVANGDAKTLHPRSFAYRLMICVLSNRFGSL